jgi:hypothetical protein
MNHSITIEQDGRLVSVLPRTEESQIKNQRSETLWVNAPGQEAFFVQQDAIVSGDETAICGCTSKVRIDSDTVHRTIQGKCHIMLVAIQSVHRDLVGRTRSDVLSFVFDRQIVHFGRMLSS